MDVTAFLQIGIVGVALSGVIQYIKTKFGTESLTTMAITVVASLAIGGGYFYLQGTDLLDKALEVLASATLAYNFIINPLAKSSKPE